MREKLMIRLAGRGQYELPADEALLSELNELDQQIAALLAGTESELLRLLEKMTNYVQARGVAVVDEVAASDLILPPTDLTLAEAAEIFEGEGLIPELAG